MCFSWKEMWLQDYWQSLDQAEALTAMIHHNESHQGKFWDYMHKVFMKRTQQNWVPWRRFQSYMGTRLAAPKLLFCAILQTNLSSGYSDWGSNVAVILASRLRPFQVSFWCCFTCLLREKKQKRYCVCWLAIYPQSNFLFQCQNTLDWAVCPKWLHFGKFTSVSSSPVLICKVFFKLH